MAKGTGTYDDPIICDGLFSKTIGGVKKFFKLKTGTVDTSNLVKKSGDTLNGNYFFSDGCNLYKTNKTSTLKLNASNDGKDGARLVLCGKDTKDYPAEFNLCANDGTSDVQLIGKANGELYWNNKNIVRSINNILADRNGNVQFILEHLLDNKEQGYLHLCDNFILAWSNSGYMPTGTVNSYINKPKPFTTLACFVSDSLASATEMNTMDTGNFGWYKNRSTKTTDYFYYSNPKIELGIFSVIWIGVVN